MTYRALHGSKKWAARPDRPQHANVLDTRSSFIRSNHENNRRVLDYRSRFHAQMLSFWFNWVIPLTRSSLMGSSSCRRLDVVASMREHIVLLVRIQSLSRSSYLRVSLSYINTPTPPTTKQHNCRGYGSGMILIRS